MNYLGTMSILDRGDAPAQAVIDKNSRALAQRVANETKEELEKVMHRVENICENFEMTNDAGFGSNMEFVSDITELAELLQDQVKKKKYQAQVTVFIVGFQEVSSQKLKLLQQVNEFFLDSIRNYEDDIPNTPDIDLEDVTHKIDESLDVARGLATRLGEINQDIIEYLIHYAENKAKNKSAQGEGKGKKKLEKALQTAKDDLTSLSEKLLSIQSDLEEKDEKMQQLYKQLEIKTLENQKYRTAAEVAKKNLLDAEKLKDDIVMRDEKIRDMRQVISRLEIDLTQARHGHEQTQNRLDNASMESQQKLLELKKGVDGSKMESNEAKREMEKIHESQMKKMLQIHSQEIEDLNQQHGEEVEKLMEEIDSLKEQVLRIQFERSFSDGGEQVRHFDLSNSTESSLDPSRQSSRQDSRNSGTSKSKGRSKSKQDGRENSDVTESESKYKRSKSTLETVDETDVFDNVYDLKDEESWARIPAPDVPGRFKQYRKLSQSHIADLEDKLQVTLARMNRKVQTLKGQFQEHKTKWDTERKIFMNQVNQAQDLQKDAEQEADTTITQLEEFITEQEKLEIEEARKRQEMAMAINSLNKVVPGTSHTSASSDNDIQKLMQQTDDAKALASTVGEDILIDDKAIDNKESLSPGSNLPPIQQYVIKNLKAMMADPEDKLPAYQQKILETVRLALKVLNDTKVDLAEEELLRSVTVVSLASQLTHEAMQLGVRPDSLFKTLARVSRRLLEEKELELRHLLDSTVDDGFSEISFESGTEGEHSLASLRDLPILEDVSDKDVQTDKTPLPAVEITEEQMIPAIDVEQRTLQQEGTFVKEEAVVDKGSSPISISSASSTTESKEHDDDTADDTTDAEDSADVEDIETADSQSSNQDEQIDQKKSLLKSSAVSDRSYTTNSPVSDISDYRNQQSRGSQTNSSFTPTSKQNVIVVKIPDERLSSANSRQSLRSMYKNKIEESKKMAEDRKHKSAALKQSIQEVKDSEEKFDEDQEDYLKGFGFSAAGELLPEHPVVQEYIKTYNMGMGFKDALAKTLLDKDMMSASQVISDIEVHRFRHNSQVLPQLEKMTKSLSRVLSEIITLLNGILVNDRDPAVSSVMFVSRDPTMITPDSSRTPLPSRESQINLDNVDNDYVRDLQQKCNLLHKNLEESTKKHDDQLRHNTVVMLGMQDTINGLQREISTLGKAPRSRSITPSFQLNQAPSPDTSIMFTRLDAERNAKIMKKAVNDERLDQNKYKEAVSQMDKYISLPAQRLGHLVRKYVHHNRMKYIEENIQKNQNLDDGVFEVLDKMEDLQNERAKRWAEKMDSMGTERLRMANLLMETLDSIENESGIFLIKPMYSYRSRELQQKYSGKLSRPIKSRKPKSAIVLLDNHSTLGPVNTPASNIRNIHRDITLQSRESTYPVIDKTAFEGPDGVGLSGTGVSGAAGNWVGNSSNATWNVNLSQSRPSKDDISNFHNTPRILELDINRMLIGQNNISTRLSYPLTDDRLTNATQNTLRSYVTVNRPTVQPKSTDSPQSITGLKDSSAPPSTPQPVVTSAGNGVRNIDNSLPRLSSTPPLPPINKHRNLSASSSRQSPTSEMKPKRITSGFTATTSDEDFPL